MSKAANTAALLAGAGIAGAGIAGAGIAGAGLGASVDGTRAGVVGVGVDAVDVPRFRRILARRPGFAARFFTDGAGGFAATRPCTTPLHRDDAMLLFANTVVSIRPPFTPANLFDADASLGQTQPFDFCNEFSITTHEHIPASAALTQRRGLPYDRCHARLRF